MEEEDKKNKKDHFKLLFWIIAVIVVALIIILWLWNYTEEWKGEFGDKFGVINSLFSGLAFAGIIITILLQSRELKLQREELEDTREVFESQLELMKRQQNENSFFNLLENHRQLVKSFDKGEWKLGGGKKFHEQLRNSYTKSVSGYDVLFQIAEEWKHYFKIYTESYNEKRIINLNLHDYKDYTELIDSYPVAHDLYRELLVMYKFIETKLDKGSHVEFKNLLYRAITRQERFIFETLYFNFPNENEGVSYIGDFYKGHNYVNFKNCILPIFKVETIKSDDNKLRIGIETNAQIKSAKLVVYDTSPSNIYFVEDIIKLSQINSSHPFRKEYDFLTTLKNSTLNIDCYPFKNNILESKHCAVELIINSNKEDFIVLFDMRCSTQRIQIKSGEEYYEFREFKELQIDNARFEGIQHAIKDYTGILSFGQKNNEKIRQINGAINRFFRDNPHIKKIRAKEVMNEFISWSVFKEDIKCGKPIRDVLRALDKSNELYLIPSVFADRKTKNVNWYFVNHSNFSEEE